MKRKTKFIVAAAIVAVMLCALEIMNAVEAGTREPPTLAEFKAGLPQIAWSYTE